MSVSEPLSNPMCTEIWIAASPSRVFEALVSAEQLSTWWGSIAMYRTRWEVDLRVGGEYRCIATAPDGSEMTVHGRFLEIERPGRLSYTWNASWDLTGETTVMYDLVPHGKGTTIRVTQSAFSDRADQEGYRKGWAQVLAWLDDWIERGQPS